MAILAEDFVLGNGRPIPKLGFGTWRIPNDLAPAAVAEALAVGYRHVDTARVYRNEDGVGQGLKAAGVDRDRVFVTTKIPSAMKDPAAIDGCVDESLRRLDTDYIDLLLIHAPKPWPAQPGDESKTYFAENSAVWRVMEQAYRAGRLRAIGVSNFEIPDLTNLLATATIAPMVNQIELRVGYAEDELAAYCRGQGILVEAYSPNGAGSLIDNPQIAAVARRYDVSVARLCVRYALQKDALPLPRSVQPDHIRANSQIDFEIAPADMAILDALRIDPVD